MRLTVTGISEGQPIPGPFAFAVPDPDQHFRFGDNRNPRVTWADAPNGTRSFALLVVDADVPSEATDVNQEGKTVPKDLKRVDFFHWVRVDIPAEVDEIEEGEDADGVVVGGKAPGPTDKGVSGINGFTDFFAGDDTLKGVYGGYDGPAPPWNDERLHHYTFTLYALDVPSLNLQGNFTGADALKAMDGHILGRASVTGTYTLNPNL